MDCVYVLESPTGRYYVGSTKRYKQRSHTHLWRLEKGTHETPRVQQEYDMHGPMTVRPFAQPLPGVPLLELEQIVMDQAFAEGLALNMGRYADAPSRGRPFPQAAREKLSRDRKGVPLTPEKLARRRELMAGKPNPMQGRTQSDETKRKISERHKAAYAAGRTSKPPTQTAEHRAQSAERIRANPPRLGKGKLVRGEKDGEVRVWPTTIACARDIGCDLSYPSQRVNTGKLVKGWLLTYESTT